MARSRTLNIRRDRRNGHAFCAELLCLSTSDKSDPNLNGRRYDVGVNPSHPGGPARGSKRRRRWTADIGILATAFFSA